MKDTALESSPRHSDFPIAPLFLERWSPRAFTSETIDETQLLTMLEAARWAPSAFNSQPWRFAYALRGRQQFEAFVPLLVEFNQGWAKNAAALVFIASKSTMRPPNAAEDAPSRSHAFDAGTASGFLSLQANMLGWATHAMTGVDFDRAAAALSLPQDHVLQAAIGIGRRGDPASLPPFLQPREAPSDRSPLTAVAREGAFPEA